MDDISERLNNLRWQSSLSKQVQELTDIVVRRTEESSKRADYNEMYLKVLALLTPRCSGAHELSIARELLAISQMLTRGQVEFGEIEE